jgi:hypothetical protein
MNTGKKYDIEEKFKVFRNLFDKLYILIFGSLWIIATLWDIYNLQRFWLDYTVELYSSFFIFYMMIFTINQRLLPVKIYNSFSIITTIKGRGTLLIIISLVFLNDYHTLHKLCAILFLIGGILYYISEILAPTTKEELEEIEKIYIHKNIRNDRNKSDSNININSNKNNITLDDSNVDFNNLQNSINLNEDLNNGKKQDSSHNMIEDDIGQEESQKSENIEKIENEKKVVEEHQEKKTDNPYDIPEDF